MRYAKVIEDTIITVGRLPASARRLDTREWVMGLKTAPSELVAACGWFPVVDNPPTFDPDTEARERGGVVLVDDTPTVSYTVRPLTVEELAARQQASDDEADRDAARQAVDNLRAYIDTTSPTAAQTVAAVKLLCRVAIRLIRDQYGR